MPSIAPPTKLVPTLSPSNILQSFYRPLYEDLNRANLWYSNGVPSSIEAQSALYRVFNHYPSDERDRDGLPECSAFIYPVLVKHAGGRGDTPSELVLSLNVKPDRDIYTRVSRPLIDEIIRIYQRPLSLYDYAGDGEETSNQVIPVYSCTENGGINEENNQEWTISFYAYVDARAAAFGRPK